MFTKEEHLRKTIAPYGEQVKLCSFDVRVGGDYRYGVTTLTYSLAFRDQAGRDHMTGLDGLKANFDHIEDLLRSLLDTRGTASP